MPTILCQIVTHKFHLLTHTYMYPHTCTHTHKYTCIRTRIDYFGGDGPHYSPPYPNPLHRNSSFALATLRPDGFVGLSPQPDTKSARRPYQFDRSSGTARTVPLLVSAPRLLVTADAAPSGRVSVGVGGAGLPGGWVACGVVAGRNVTDEVMECDLSAVVGQRVAIELNVTQAVVFMLGFTKSK